MKKNSNSLLLDVLSVAVVVAPGVMSTAMLSLAFTDISISFATSHGVVQWRNVLFFSVFAISILYFGAVLDRIGTRRAISLGQVLFIFGSLLSAITEDWNIYLVAQAIQALADGMLVPAQLALIRKIVPQTKWGWAFGWFHGTLAAAAMIGPLAGAALISHFGWQSIHLTLAGLQLLILAGTHFCIPTIDDSPQRSVSLPPLTSAGLLLLILCACQAAQLTSLNFDQELYIGSALGMIVLLVLYERRIILLSREPLIPWQALRNFDFALALLRIFLVFVVVNASVLHLPAGIRAISDVEIGYIGAAFSLSALLSTVLEPLLGRLADRFGHVSLIFGLVGLAVSSACYYFVAQWGAAATLMIASVIAALAGGLFGSAQLKMATLAVGAEDRNKFMGFYMFCQFISGAFAASLLGVAIQDGATGHITLPSFHRYITIIVCALVLATGTALVSSKREKSKIETPAA